MNYGPQKYGKNIVLKKTTYVKHVVILLRSK